MEVLDCCTVRVKVFSYRVKPVFGFAVWVIGFSLVTVSVSS